MNTATAVLLDNNPLPASSTIDVVVMQRENIADILTLQSYVENALENKIDRVFLKQRARQDYEAILADGGALFGFYQNGELIGSTGINNALGKGRVEITITDEFNQNNVAVLQATMTHPKTWGQHLGIPQMAFDVRKEWALAHNKSHLFASVCCNVLDPKTLRYPTNPKNDTGNPYKNGNWGVINGLIKQGFEPQKGVSSIQDKGLWLHIMTLAMPLKERYDGACASHLKPV